MFVIPAKSAKRARAGIQSILNLMDSGFFRNDEKKGKLTFYETVSPEKHPDSRILNHELLNPVYMLPITEKPEGLIFKIFVQPKASRNVIAGLYGDALKIKLTAPPVEGAANRMCLKYLAKCLNVPPSKLEIISGHSSRTKRILFRYQNRDVSEQEKKHLKQKIMVLLPGS